MSRSGYNDDCDDMWQAIKWRGWVASATRGKRGQKLLRDLLDALDAMPWWRRKLIVGELVEKKGMTKQYCVLGVLGARRGIDMKDIEVEDSEQVGEVFDISHCLASEIVYMNDEVFSGYDPKGRWREMRNWVESQIKTPSPKPE